MVNRNDNRSLDLYLLLLAYSKAAKAKEFFINLESMGLSLGLPSSWSDSALRRQVIKSLKRLQNQYHLIDVNFFYGKDAAVRLNPTVFASEAKQSQFTIETNSIIKTKDTELTTRLKYLLLIKAFLKNEGEDLDSIQKTALAKRFFISRSTITAAFNDLRS